LTRRRLTGESSAVTHPIQTMRPPMPNIVSSKLFDHTDTNPGAPSRNSGPTRSRGQHDDLSLPNGSVIGQTDNESLRRIFAGLGIPDAWTLGRDRLVERYVQMLKKIFDEACPLYPQKQTLELSRVMSAMCQKRTSQVCSIRSPHRRARTSSAAP